jgi:multidrug efflux pump subunit AcrA (membrane-fusion protein)
MQHLEGGIIDELRVQDGGDIVQAGQVLIRLDPAQEIGDGMDEGVLVAAGEARDPPAVHVGVLGAGDVDPVGAGGP